MSTRQSVNKNRGLPMETRLEKLTQEAESLDRTEILEAIRIQTEIVHIVSKKQCTAGVRGDALHKLAHLFLQNGQPLPARDAIAQSVVLRRMFYGRLSSQVKESLELAKQIHMRVALQIPSLVMESRRKWHQDRT
jgi:hypothetical protein